MKTTRTNNKITPETVRFVELLYNALGDNKLAWTKKLHTATKISIFTLDMLYKANFNYEAYRALIREYGDAQKKRKLLRETGVMPSVSEVKLDRRTREARAAKAGVVSPNEVVIQLKELVCAVRELTDAWKNSPRSAEIVNTVQQELEDSPLYQPRSVSV